MKFGLAIIGTLLIIIGLEQDVKLIGFKSSECYSDLEPYQLKTRIIDQTFSGDTLNIELASTGTCCVDFIPELSFINDTLNLGFEETGIPCECVCGYHFTYQIYGVKNKSFNVKFQSKIIEKSMEPYKTFPIKYFIFKGDTTGYIDKYGLRQGVIVSESNGYLMQRHMKDDKCVKYVLTDVNGKILVESNELVDILKFKQH